MSDMELERPEADAVEQDQDAIPGAGEPDQRHELPLEADEADAAEQGRDLGLHEDDYR
ncbi:MAG TPA: hypothetical protein VGJ50_11295 [Streptosporangiaceae bacterium]|jgi:hypothetical protein